MMLALCNSLVSPNAAVVNHYPSITRLALIGDSRTQSTGGTNVGGFLTTFAAGHGSYLRRACQGRLTLVRNTVSGFIHFGLNGATAAWFISGHAGENATAVSYWDAFIASDAEAGCLLVGDNDMVDAGGYSGAECAANILTLVDQAIAAGKSMIVILPTPQRESASDSANYLARRLACNADLYAGQVSRGRLMQIIDGSSALDANEDNYLDTDLSIDTVHWNITGAARIGTLVGQAILPRTRPVIALDVPEYGSARWKTPNPFAEGTVGVGNTATSWNLTSVVVQGKALTARTDGVPGNWQEITVSDAGVPPGFVFPLTAGYFANIYIDQAAFVTGATLKAVAEFQLVSGTFYHAQLVINHNSGNKTADVDNNGGLGSISIAQLLDVDGWLESEPWASSGATSLLRVGLWVWGNCVIKLGRFGVYEVL